jgi:DNA-binding MarR family transcriptional regulator
MQVIEPLTEVGVELPAALVTVGRLLRARTAEGADEAWVAWLLHHVAAREPLRLSDLAASVGLDASTVSRHVKSLDDAGYVQRIEDPADRRACRVALTAAGRAALDATMAARADAISAALADWSAEDRRMLTTLVTRLADSLSRVGAAKETR